MVPLLSAGLRDMGSIATQTDGSCFGNQWPHLFICIVNNRDIETQCCLPTLIDSSTSTKELIEKYPVCIKSGRKNNAEIRTRKRKAVTEFSTTHESNAAIITKLQDGEQANEHLTHICVARHKRERKIPVKFDPSDADRTTVTSRLAPQEGMKLEDEELSSEDCSDTADEDWQYGVQNPEDRLRDSSVTLENHSGGGFDKSICSLTSTSSCNGLKYGELTRTDEKNSDDMKSLCNNVVGDMNVIVKEPDLKRKKQNAPLSLIKQVSKYKNKNGPFRCKYCNAEFRLASAFLKHMQNHVILQSTQKHMIKCKLCGKSLSSKVNLRRHMMIHNGKPFCCELCGKRYTGQYLLREHLKMEHNKLLPSAKIPTDYQCQACKRYLASRNSLQYHQAYIRTCSDCDTKWPCRTSLRDHVLHAHDKASVNEDGRLRCSYCDKTFTYRHLYLNHIAQHSDEKKYVCQKCGKGMLTSEALYYHTKQVHEKHKYRYPCSYCGKAFICNAKLVEHIRTHTGEKPFVCNICDAAFAAKATYKTHIRLIHSKNSTQKRWKRKKETNIMYKYNCPLCNEQNLRGEELSEHCWTVHSATVQFSYEIPEKISASHNDVSLDIKKSAILDQKQVVPQKTGDTKEIIVCEESTEIIIPEGRTEIVLSEGSSEIVVSEGATEVSSPSMVN